jgi:hypothetical protein
LNPTEWCCCLIEVLKSDVAIWYVPMCFMKKSDVVTSDFSFFSFPVDNEIEVCISTSLLDQNGIFDSINVIWICNNRILQTSCIKIY